MLPPVKGRDLGGIAPIREGARLRRFYVNEW